MSNKPTTPSSLLRSLGADESFFEAKQKASAREAEQRWPLFRALAPTKSEMPPALSDEEKQVWEQAKPATTQARKPLLSRPGLSSKLAASLEKFAKTPEANAQTKQCAVKTSAEDVRITAPVPTAARAKATAPAKAALAKSREPESSSATPTVTPPSPPSLPSQGLFSQSTPNTPDLSSASSSAGLFAKTEPAPTATKTRSRNSGSSKSASEEIPPTAAKRVAPPKTADESLTDLFNRVEGKAPPARNGRTGNSTSTVMRRIGKR